MADRATRSFDLVNESAFPVTFALRAVKSGHANLGPLPPFDVSPTAGEIPPGRAQPLSFTFAPDHARPTHLLFKKLRSQASFRNFNHGSTPEAI